MLQMRDITVPLPQRRPDLDKFHPQKVDRLIAFTKLTLVMNKVTEARYAFVPMKRSRVYGC